MPQATGQFSVSSTPLEPTPLRAHLGLMQMKFEKKFEGELEGKKGSSYFQHSSTMHKGQAQHSAKVVPGSGTEELAGLSGEMFIDIRMGKHYYTFRYEL